MVHLSRNMFGRWDSMLGSRYRNGCCMLRRHLLGSLRLGAIETSRHCKMRVVRSGGLNLRVWLVQTLGGRLDRRIQSKPLLNNRWGPFLNVWIDKCFKRDESLGSGSHEI
jgi:hypothetical protein